MPSKRYGEGSVYFDEARGLWIGQVYFGPGDRPKVTARSKKAMLEKMQARREAGPRVSASGGVADWVETWLTTIKARTISEGTLADYRKWNKDYIRPYLGTIPTDKLDLGHVDQWLCDLEEADLSPRTIAAARGLLGQALKAAVRRGKCVTNVVALSEGPRIRHAKTQDRLEADDAQVLLKTVRDDWLFPLAALCLFLGIRPGEAYALRWKHVNFTKGIINIPGTKTRSAVRSVPLPAFVAAALRGHQDNQKAVGVFSKTGLVFTDEEGLPLKQREVSRWWHDALKRADIPRRRFYSTRHTAATLMLNNGVALEVVSKILGHAKLSTTSDFYAEVGGKMQHEAADVMDDVLGFS
jgi:integrase